MATLSIDVIQPGMELAAPVKNPQGQVLFGAGITLKEKHIEMMMAWGVGEVEIVVDDQSDDETSRRMEAMIKREEENIMKRFTRGDLEHPVVREIIRCCAERRVERASREGTT